MTEKEKFISALLALVKTPLSAGENPIVPTEEQITELNAAENKDEAMKIAVNYGWADYVNEVIVAESQEGIQEQSQIEQAIANALAQGQQGFIGVDGTQPIVYEGVTTTIGEVGENFYMDGDQNVFSNLMPNEIRELQADLINAGLLGSKVNRPFRPGVWNPNIEGRAMYDLMTQANVMGKGKAEDGWRYSLQLYLDNPIQEPEKIQTYLPPDYNAISNSIDGLFESELGRKPKEYEIRLLADTYSANAKKAYEQQVALETPMNVDITPETLEEYGNHIQPVVEEGVTAIDPGARMLDTFNNITAKEQERLGVNRDIQATNRIILNSITGAPR